MVREEQLKEFIGQTQISRLSIKYFAAIDDKELDEIL